MQTNSFAQIKAEAEKGDVVSQFNLGICYENGKGVATNYVEAAKWYLKAADQNDAPAQANLGGAYIDGKGVAQDYVEAAKWLRKAAEQGNAQAQRMLGGLYANGDGVPQHFVEAYKWSSLAAAQGDSYAVTNRNLTATWLTSQQIAEAQELSREFKSHSKSSSDNSTLPDNPAASGTGFFITDDGYLISNYHVVKDATKVRLLTGAGLIDAKVVQVDAANDLALLKADGRFAPLPIAASRTGLLGGTVATVGFPDIGLQGFAPKLAP
jgi:TPR repeat protein